MTALQICLLVFLAVCVILVAGVLVLTVFMRDEENDRDDFEQEEATK
jgi:hypothetical protein